jgi:hypothetical protein
MLAESVVEIWEWGEKPLEAMASPPEVKSSLWWWWVEKMEVRLIEKGEWENILFLVVKFEFAQKS